MTTLAELEQGLHGFLDHLYDPAHQPPDALLDVLDPARRCDREAVHSAVIQAIEALKPQPQVPPTARPWRIYHVLSLRYVQRLTQEDAAERLGITARHLRREQHMAVRVLAERILRGHKSETVPSPVSTDWLHQVHEDLQALRQVTASPAANVAEVLTGVVTILRDLAGRRGVELRSEQADPALLVAIHPAALRQALVTGISALLQTMTCGQIVLGTLPQGNRLRITIATSLSRPPGALPIEVMSEFVAAYGGEVCVEAKGETLVLAVDIPLAGIVTVLAIDDNADLIHVYKRYTLGTRYRVVTVAESADLLEAIAALAPDIIILDVMLPHIDGWELLAHLHERPETRAIPIIVCSVVRQEELALALGAVSYLPKPVLREQFLLALEQAVRHADARAGTTPGPTG